MVESTFVSLLRQNLVNRQQKNPRYSLRAFSRDLGMSATYISLLLSGKKLPSVRRASDIAQILQLRPEEARQFLTSVLETKNPETKRLLDNFYGEGELFEEYGSTYFQLLNDWYTLGVLELTQVSDFVNDRNWMAKRLGISQHQVMNAFGILTKLGVIYQDKNAKIKKKNPFLQMGSKISESAIRRYHKIMMERALQELEKTDEPSFERRSITSLSFPANPQKIERAFDMIERFRKRLSEFMSDGKTEDVFQLNLQFFPLTKRKTEA